jgi:PAS domain-containing protein/RNase H-fold protein (predicted Holliday junction resolvase)
MGHPVDRDDIRAGVLSRDPGCRPRAGGPPRARPERGEVLSALGELEIAHEELRVAEEQLAEHRAQSEELLARYESGQRWREHLFALLPVGVLVTDDVGTVVDANGAAAALLGIRPALLMRKPLPVYVDPAQRRLVRDLVVRLRHGEQEERALVTLRGRCSQPRSVELIALRDPATDPRAIRWLIMPRDGAAAHGRACADDDDLRAATAIAELCTLPVDAMDQQRLLSQIAFVVRSAVRSATTVSVIVGDPLSPERLASDSIEAQTLDGLQMRAGEGPCVDAFRGGGAVVVSDVTADDRWPRLAAASRAQPLRSVMALPIRLADERAGVVTVYGHEVGVFVERTLRVGEIVASAVASVLHGAYDRSSLEALVHHLERALSSRAVIEQAKGIVMAHHGGTADEAFARLVTYSSRHNVKLRDLATLIVESGGGTALRGL